MVAREGVNPTMLRGTTAEEHLNTLLGLENHLGKALAPTRSLRWAGRPTKTYYVSPGGFLHRKDPPGATRGRATSVATSTMDFGTT